MLSKNEIKLLETRNEQIIRRLVFTENGFVRLVDDYHFEGISANTAKQTLEVKEISPTVRLQEEDYVIEQTLSEGTSGSRFELYRFTDGRLRSLSLSANLAMIQIAISKNRDINRWMTYKNQMVYLAAGSMDRIHLNESWSNPTAVAASRALLKNLIHSPELWEGEHCINPKALVMSYHKLHRLYSKQNLVLNKRNKPLEIDYDPALLEEEGVWYFSTSPTPHGSKGSIKYDVPYVRVTGVANLEVESSISKFVYGQTKDIYRLELVVFKKLPELDIPKVGMD